MAPMSPMAGAMPWLVLQSAYMPSCFACILKGDQVVVFTLTERAL
jgi:hypothetical protein